MTIMFSISTTIGVSALLMGLFECESTMRSEIDSSTWIASAMGDTMAEFISNVALLEDIINFDKQIFDATTAATQVLCSSYSHGHNIAKYYQGEKESEQVIRPLYVSEMTDRMCFAVYSSVVQPLFVSNLSDFSFVLPSTYKVMPRMYSFVANSSEPMPEAITVSYLINMTTLSHVDVSSSAQISQEIEALRNYRTEIFESFFWTSLSTEEFLSNQPDSREGDKLKSSMMRSAISPLISQSAAELDVCTFRNISFINHVDHVDISLDLLKGLNSTMQRACVLFIFASLSLQRSVWSLDFTKKPELLNFRARSILQTSTVGSDSYFTPYTRLGLRGDNQVVGIADTGIDMNSCYFNDPTGNVQYSSMSDPVSRLDARKVVQYAYWPGQGDTGDENSGHGTHVAGIVAGNILNSDITKGGMYGGVAPNALISFLDLAQPGTGLSIPSVNELYSPGYSVGARVFTNSWGTTDRNTNYYVSSNTDLLLYNNMDITILFSAGNFGFDGSRTVTLEAQAKNVVSVGSTQTTFESKDIDNVSFFSSQGPSYDGRIKPDIVATGEAVVSAKSNGNQGASCNTITMVGTSMASPSAAGIALLIRQYFIGAINNFWFSTCNRKYVFCKNFSPSGVLVKAALLHSGSPMSLLDGASSRQLNSPPDNVQGYGRITLLNILPLSGYTRFDLFVDDLVKIEEYSSIAYYVTITDTLVPIKVTLSWYDPPSVYGSSSKALIHNLDLTVTSPSGHIRYGNSGDSADHLNNNEQISIRSPIVGSYKVSITANSLPATGSQLFSLIITSGGSVGQCTCS